MATNFEQRKQARLERAKKMAEKKAAESAQFYEAAREIGSHIPFGQPILIGHHSEKRHRRDIEKIDSKMRKSVEAEKAAEYYTQKAAAIENSTAISSDDPHAIEKLTAKLDELKQYHEYLKTSFKCLKKKIDKEAYMKIKGATEERWEEIMKWGLSSWQLKNNYARMKQVQERISVLQSLANRTTKERSFGTVKVIENVEENRVQIFFNERLSPENYKLVRKRGFVYSKKNKAFQRFLNSNGIYTACELAKQIAEQK